MPRQKLQRARELRREMTPAEQMLWQALRRNQLGVHFRRQQVIEGFIVDFYCHAAGLVIELDGGAHRGTDQKESDAFRDHVLSDKGLRVVRFHNREIEARLPNVLEEIRSLTKHSRSREP